MKLNDYHLRLLAEGINNNGRLQSSLADRIYSSPGKGREALISLESWGFMKLSPIACGVFIVIKAPPEAFDMAVQLKEAKAKSESKTKDKIEQVKAEITNEIDDNFQTGEHF